MMIDGDFRDLDIQSIVDKVTEAKNHHGRFSGYSPVQWFHGRKHPLIDSESVVPSLNDADAFGQHMARKAQAASCFHQGEAKAILNMALKARSRAVTEFHSGQVVYYFRRGKPSKKMDPHLPRVGYRGPARVLAVENLEKDRHIL